MSTNKSCTNCPGATDHDTAHCPLRVIRLGDLNPEQRLALARGVTITQSRMGFGDKRSQGVGYWTPEQAESAQGARPPLNVLAQALNGEMILITLGTPIRQLAVPVDHLADFTDAPDVVVIRPRAALAQPSPKCATCGDTGAIVISGPHYHGEFEPPEYEMGPCDMCEQPSSTPELDQLRYKADLYDEVWALVTGKGYMNITTAIAKLEQERDAAQARVAELERVLATFAEVADAYDPAEDDSFQPWKDAPAVDFLRLTLGQHRVAKAALGATAPVAQAGQVPEVGNPKWAIGTLREAVEYLDANSLNQITSGSVLHRCMRGALDAAAPAQGGE